MKHLFSSTRPHVFVCTENGDGVSAERHMPKYCVDRSPRLGLEAPRSSQPTSIDAGSGSGFVIVQTIRLYVVARVESRTSG